MPGTGIVGMSSAEATNWTPPRMKFGSISPSVPWKPSCVTFGVVVSVYGPMWPAPQRIHHAPVVVLSQMRAGRERMM